MAAAASASRCSPAAGGGVCFPDKHGCNPRRTQLAHNSHMALRSSCFNIAPSVSAKNQPPTSYACYSASASFRGQPTLSDVKFPSFCKKLKADRKRLTAAKCSSGAHHLILSRTASLTAVRSCFKGNAAKHVLKKAIRRPQSAVFSDSSGGATTDTALEGKSKTTNEPAELFQTVRLATALSLAQAVDCLRKVVDSLTTAEVAKQSPQELTVLRYEVPIPPTVNALRWLRSQPATPPLLPRVYYSPRAPRGGYGGPSSSQEPQHDASSASGIDGGGIGSVAGVGSALTVTGPGAFGWQEWATVRAYLSQESPLVRAYGGTRFNDNEAPAAEWAAFGSYYFVIPQVELREGASGSLLACTLVWGGPALEAPSRGAALAAAKSAMAQLSKDITARQPKPSLSTIRKTFHPNQQDWVSTVERVLSSFPEEDPDGGLMHERLLENMPLSKVVLARRTTLEMGQTIDPLVILECLQERDPSAYQFLIQLPTGQAFFGSTPERLFVRHGVAVASEAVAGTRPRGVPVNTPMDQRIAYEILLSEKENREFEIVRDSIHSHMLVVCREVEVEVPKKLIKQATVQHLYGRLNGVLRSDAQEFDMLSKLHPTPAVCGHPQGRAKEAIADNEPFDRGMYAGPIGWLGGNGCEFAVAIRSALTHSEDITTKKEEGVRIQNPEKLVESTSSEAVYGVSSRQGGESTSGRSAETFGRSQQRAKNRRRPVALRPLEVTEVPLNVDNGESQNGSKNGSDLSSSYKTATSVPSKANGSSVGSLADFSEQPFRPGKKISLFAGVGIVRGADPLAEWRELNLKTSQFERVLSPLPALRESPNVNALWARLIIEECCRLGATYFCIAPGSRSSPLAAAAASHPRARCISCIDERSLAFHALGYGRARNVPAVVITSSGTAVSNLMPAVVEAHQDCVPLLLITADRPPELRDSGANQTIDQVKHFGSFVRYHSDLPPPDTALPARMVLTTVDQAVHRSTGSPAGPVHLNCAFREPLTPIEKPFQPSALQGLLRWETSSSPFTSYVQTPSSGQGLGEVLNLLSSAKKGLILVGGRGGSPDDTWAILKLSDKLGWPIVADAVSGLRVVRSRTLQSPHFSAKPPVIYHFDHVLLGADSDDIRTLLAPDVVLQLGARVTSKRTCTFLDSLDLEGYVLVDDNPFRHDPSHVLSHRVDMKIAHFAKAVIQSLGGGFLQNGKPNLESTGLDVSLQASNPAARKLETTLGYTNGSASSDQLTSSEQSKGEIGFEANPPRSADSHQLNLSEYGQMLIELSEAVGRELATWLNEEEDLSEPQVARIIAGSIAGEGALFLGNSMAIRDVDMYAEDFLGGSNHPGTGPPGFGNIPDPGTSIGPVGVGTQIAANRGASGIDGVLSTATGFAAGLGRPVTLLIGDVSFLHDTNGLLLVNNRPGQPPVVTVVVNNSGGGIFSLLPNVDSIPPSHFTQYWSTPHDVFLERLCSGHRVKYTLAKNERELRAALAFAWQRRMSWVIEVQTDMEDNVTHHKTLQAAAKRTVQSALAFGRFLSPSSSLEDHLLQIRAVHVSKFRIELSNPPTTKSRETGGVQLRNGLLVQIYLRSGAVGTGEITPLEGLHAESLAEAEEEVEKLRGALIGRKLPRTLHLLGGAIASWMQHEVGVNSQLLPPSVCCGIETALLTSLANHVGKPLSELLLGRPGNDQALPRGSSGGPLVCALLASEGSPEEAAEEARAAVARGFCTLKLKVARRSTPEQDAAAVSAIRSAVGPQITIRVDANRRWSLHEATAFGLAAKGLNLQYVEEPVDNPCDISEFYQRTGVAVALDESVDEGLVGAHQTDLPLGSAQGVVALVIKPSRVGGIENTAALARWASKRGINTVISSAFESSVGLSAYAEIARFLDQRREKHEEGVASKALDVETLETSNLTNSGEPFSAAIRSAFEMSGVPVEETPDIRTFLDKLERQEKRDRRKKDRLLERVRLREEEGQRIAHGLGTCEWLKSDVVSESRFVLTSGEEGCGLEVDMTAVSGLLANPLWNPEIVKGLDVLESSESRDPKTIMELERNSKRLRTENGAFLEREVAVQHTTAEYRFRVIEVGSEVPSGAPLVLLLHGFLGSGTDWLSVMQHLEGTARLMAVDLPGHGHTQVLPKPETLSPAEDFASPSEEEGSDLSCGSSGDSAYSMPSVGEALMNLVRQTGERGQRVTVVGYSMGARLALYLAMEYPEVVEDVVIISGSPGLLSSADREARAQHDDRLADQLTSRGVPDFVEKWYEAPLWQSLRETPGFEELVAARTASASVDGLSRALRGLSTGRQPSLWEELPGYAGRVLWLTGKKDTKFIGIARDVENRVGKRWTFEEAECGHAVHVEDQTTVVRLLQTFISNAG